MLKMNYNLNLENHFVMHITAVELDEDGDIRLYLDEGSTMALSMLCGFPVACVMLIVCDDDYTCHVYAESAGMAYRLPCEDDADFYKVFPCKNHVEAYGLSAIIHDILG